MAMIVDTFPDYNLWQGDLVAYLESIFPSHINSISVTVSTLSASDTVNPGTSRAGAHS